MTDKNTSPVPPVGWNPNQAAPVFAQPMPQQPPMAQPMQQPVAAQPLPQQPPAAQQMYQPLPQQPQPQQPPVAQPKPKREGAEQVIGRTVLGIVAAVLVFLGVVYFGISLIPQLTDQVKVALMFGISIVLVVTGGALAIKRGGAFASALMGCGACSLFASTYIAQLRFEMINDIAAYAIILAWMIMCLAFIKKTQSVLLAVVLQVGLALSVWFGYVDGGSRDQIGLLLLYQAVATVIVVGGNMLFHRKMIRSSLVLAIALNLTTSLFIQLYYDVFDWFGQQPDAGSYYWAAISLSVQLVAAALLAGMLSKSAIDDEAACRAGQLERFSSASWLVLASLAWFFATKLDAQFAVQYCLRRAVGTTFSSLLAAACVIVLLVCSAFVLAAYARKRGLELSSGPVVPAIAIIVTGAVLTALEASVDGGGIWTVCCMACALACIVAGFRFRINWLRLYGLVSVLVCVAKLVLVDFDMSDPVARAASLVAGGLICFAISALYTNAQRRMNEGDANTGLAQ